MLFVPDYQQTFANQRASYGTTRPSNVLGTSVTPGNASEGTWTAVGSAITNDCYAILVGIDNAATSTTPRNYAVDVGVDPAGGTSYAAVITDLLAGGASSYNVLPYHFYFPLFIPSGSTIAVRAQGADATNITAYVITHELPRNPIKVGSYTETIGVTPGAIVGVAVTPGTTSEGTWTSLGTTVKNLWSWQVSLQVDASDTAWTANTGLIDLAVGDATNKDIILNNVIFTSGTSENAGTLPKEIGTSWFVPAGSTLYARAQMSATLDTYTVAAYGTGG